MYEDIVVACITCSFTLQLIKDQGDPKRSMLVAFKSFKALTEGTQYPQPSDEYLFHKVS